MITHGGAAARSGNGFHESADDDLEVLGLGRDVGVCSAVRAGQTVRLNVAVCGLGTNGSHALVESGILRA